MNTCLLAKWIDKLERRDNSLCCTLLRNKYLGEKSIFQIKSRKGYRFWRSLLEVRSWYQMGRCININSGKQTWFWHDCWLGDCALKVNFPDLFQVVVHPDLEVAKAWVDDQWHLSFRRQLNGILGEQWRNLLELLDGIVLSNNRDEVYWALERSKKYSTSSLYKLMTSGGVQDV
jgi:hypothetical protein